MDRNQNLAILLKQELAVNGHDAIRYIKRHGWKLVRIRGSHNHFKHPTIKGLVTIPLHGSKNLHPNILNSISRTTGLTI